MQDITAFIANHMALSYTFAIALVLLSIVEFIRAKRNYFSINTAHAVQLINRDNAVVFDIRDTETYKKGHIIDSISITPSDLQSNAKKMEKYKKKPLIIVCTSGIESQKAASGLLKQGYNVYSIAGGMRAWTDSQMPLTKG